MNLRQLEEMVKVLRARGYDDRTKIFAQFLDGDGDTIMEEIAQVTSVSDDGEGHPAFIIMDTEYSLRKGQGYNSNLKLEQASFPFNFPGPNA